MSLALIKTSNQSNNIKKSFSEWKELTVSANEAFREGHSFYADCLYEKAADKAKYLFSKLICNRDSVAALLVSLHNLAYFHLANSNRRCALDCLNEAVSYLTKSLKTNNTDSTKEAAIIWGLGQANQQLWLIERKLYKNQSVFIK
jgi:hypothetical protein